MNPYRLFGYLGFGAAVLQTFLWAHVEKWPWKMAPLLSCASALAFYAALRLSYVLLGHERIVFLEHLLAVMAGAFVTAKAAALPLGRSIDVVVLGVGTFLTFGRLGCTAVGCCFGRPFRHGIRYRPSHVAAGMHPLWAGTRLFPLQVVESVLSASLVALAFWYGGQASIYILGYALVRFPLEFARGDLRPEFLGVSEAQWLSVLLAWGLWLVTRSTEALLVSLGSSALLATVLAWHERLEATAWALGSASHVISLEEQLARAGVAEGKSFATNRGICIRRCATRVIVSRREPPLGPSHLRVLAYWIGQALHVAFDIVAHENEYELRPADTGARGAQVAAGEPSAVALDVSQQSLHR